MVRISAEFLNQRHKDEILRLKKIHNHNLVKFEDAFISAKSKLLLIIVTEAASHGCLERFIRVKTCRAKHISEETIWDVIK